MINIIKVRLLQPPFDIDALKPLGEPCVAWGEIADKVQTASGEIGCD